MRCNDYLKLHMNKLNRNTLKDFYSRHEYTDDLSKTCYLIDKNLEKQVVTLLKNFCLQGNREMQDYLREQKYNSKSYNMVLTTTDYASEFLTHLQYPVALDTFVETLSALHELIQGPDNSNQEILIQHNFIEDANEILQLNYTEDEKMKKKSKSNKRRC